MGQHGQQDFLQPLALQLAHLQQARQEVLLP